MAKGMRSTAIHRDELGGAAIADAGPTSARALKEMDPEHAARRILSALMEGRGRAAVVVPAASGAPAEFKSLGVEKVPFTGTQMVKFRQQFHKIPVYGSLVTVELDDSNGFVAVNSSLGEPSGVDAVATLSPAQAIQAIKEWAGYGDQELVEPTRLNFYFDQKAERWRLVYIVEDVLRHTPRRPQQQDSLTALPEYSDFVLDAHTGERVAELPRTQTMAQTDAQQSAADTLGVTRDFQVLTDSVANASSLHDRQRNVHTHDFGFRDTVLQRSELPGPYVGNPPNPWEPGAVSAHANAAEVVNFLKQVLLRDGLDGRGGKVISSVNCLRFGESVGREWRNAARIPGQMIYGQRLVGGRLRSYAAALDVVAHELLHGLTDHTARLEYRFQSGALNESYSDIFGIIVSNIHNSSIDTWNWEMGEDLTVTGIPIRDMRDPTRFRQPAHMDDFLVVGEENDHGGVHTNSGIHNKAAFNILTAKAGGRDLFTAVEMARLFYVTLSQHLTRTSEFVDSRKGAVLTARSLFQGDPQREAKVAAVQKGFDDVGIVEPGVA